MPQIDISQSAYDALKREAERFNAEHSADDQRPPATVGGLASDFLLNACRDPDEADDEPAIPY